MKIKLLTASMLAFILFIGLGQTGNVQAADSLDSKKKDVEENLNKVEQDIVSAAEKVNELNENVEVLETAISSNEEDLTKEKKNVEKYDEEVKSLKDEIKSLENEIKERNEILKERLSSYQNTGGDLGYLEVIFGSAGFEEFISRFTAVSTITKADNDLVEEQKRAVEKVESKEEEVKEKLTEAEQTKDKLAKINEVKKGQKSELVKSVASAEKEQSKLEEKKASYVKEGNDIKALEAKVEAIQQEKNKALAEQVEEQEAEQKETSNVEQVSAKNTDNQAPKKAKATDKKTQPKSTNQTANKPKKDKQTTSKPKPDKKPVEKPAKPSNDSIKEITMSATGYTAKCAGCSGITATGIDLNSNPNAKVVAVDPSVIPLGSRVWVSGYGEAIAGDTGGAIKGNRIDLHFPTKEAALGFGRGTVTVKILK